MMEVQEFWTADLTYDPGTDPYSITEEIAGIWEHLGFFWGGRWEPERFDPMHFAFIDYKSAD